MSIIMWRKLFVTFQLKTIILIHSNTYVYKSVLRGPIGIRNNKTSRLLYIEDLQELLLWKSWRSQNWYAVSIRFSHNYNKRKVHTHHRRLKDLSLLNFYSLLHGHSISLYSCMLTYILFQIEGSDTWRHSLYQSNPHYRLNQSKFWWNKEENVIIIWV